MERQKAEVVHLKPNVDRIVATITYVIEAARRLNVLFSQYDIVKSMFLADRAHLNEFGRLISSDKYVAMVHGPVPSVAYGLLKRDERTMRRYRVEALPWRASQDPNKDNVWLFHDADTRGIEEFLSPSDMAAIDAAVSTINSLSFPQIRKLTHEDPAYVDAWEDDGDRKQFPMSLGMLFDAPNFERARELSEMSQFD